MRDICYVDAYALVAQLRLESQSFTMLTDLSFGVLKARYVVLKYGLRVLLDHITDTSVVCPHTVLQAPELCSNRAELALSAVRLVADTSLTQKAAIE